MKKHYLIALTCLLLTACGQKGPLYLPDESTATSQSAEQTQDRPDQLEYIKLASQHEQEK
jgi:predicted small lipoprotein YifL